MSPPARPQAWTDDTVFAEDIRVGARYDLGSHRVSEQEILEFATAWDPQYFHVDAEAAERASFGGLIASGVHTLSVLQKLSVAGVYEVWATIAAREMREVRFRRPVRPGDVLTGRLLVQDVRPRDEHRSLVTLAGALHDVRDEVVLSMVMDVYVGRRGASAEDLQPRSPSRPL